MPYLGLIVVVTIALVQCAAGTSALIELGLHPLLAIVAGGTILAFLPPAMALPGIYGAIHSWHWHWFWAVALFFPTLIMMFATTGAISLISLWQGYTERLQKARHAVLANREPESRSVQREELPASTSPSFAERSRALDAKESSGPLVLLLIVVILGIAVAFVAAGLRVDTPPTSSFAVASGANAPVSESASTKLGPSFDCEIATNTADRLVCSDQALAALDHEMAGLFASLLVESGATNDWQIDQMQWIRRVRDTCSTAECLTLAYGRRIEALRRDMSALTRAAPQSPLAKVPESMTISAPTLPPSWDATQATMTLLDALDGLCMRNDANFNILDVHMKGMPEWKPIPEAIVRLSAGPEMQGEAKGFGTMRDGQMLGVVWNENNSCSVMTNRLSPEVVRREILNNFQVGNTQSFKEGMQVHELFSLTQTSSFPGAALGVVYAKNQELQGYEGSIIYLPARTAQRIKAR